MYFHCSSSMNPLDTVMIVYQRNFQVLLHETFIIHISFIYLFWESYRYTKLGLRETSTRYNVMMLFLFGL